MAVKKEIITKFAIEYAMTTESHSNDWWGKRYGVTGKCIRGWLARPEIKKLVDENVQSFSDMVIDKARKNVDIAMRELKKIVKMDKYTDVKRKACNDMLGIARIENINKESGSSPAAKEQKKKNAQQVSDKELNEEYDKLLEDAPGTEESPQPTEKPQEPTIN